MKEEGKFGVEKEKALWRIKTQWCPSLRIRQINQAIEVEMMWEAGSSCCFTLLTAGSLLGQKQLRVI